MTSDTVATQVRERIAAIKAAFGAPGDHGYETREGKALFALYQFGAAIDTVSAPMADDLRLDAERYRWLRARDLGTIEQGGIFAGQTPENLVLSGDELDAAIDAARAVEAAQGSAGA